MPSKPKRSKYYQGIRNLLSVVACHNCEQKYIDILPRLYIYIYISTVPVIRHKLSSLFSMCVAITNLRTIKMKAISRLFENLELHKESNITPFLVKKLISQNDIKPSWNVDS